MLFCYQNETKKKYYFIFQIKYFAGKKKIFYRIFWDKYYENVVTFS